MITMLFPIILVSLFGEEELPEDWWPFDFCGQFKTLVPVESGHNILGYYTIYDWKYIGCSI